MRSSPYLLFKESTMYEWMFRKDEADARLKRQKDQDMKAWLLIGAVFVGTFVVVWLPIIIGAMRATHS
jgi:hypothetical protein